MKNFITEEVKEDFLESLKTIVSYPSVLKDKKRLFSKIQENLL